MNEKGKRMNNKIDKMPPVSGGNLKEDMLSVMNYLAYLREQFNFLAAKLEKLNTGDKRN